MVGNCFIGFEYKRDATLSQIWVLAFSAELRLPSVLITCQKVLKHSYKNQSVLQVVPYYFGVLNVSFDRNLQTTHVKLRW